MNTRRVGMAALIAAFGLQLGLAQAPQQPPAGNPGGQPGGSPGGSPGRTPTPTPTPQPGRSTTPGEQRQQFPEIQRAIFLSGKVIMEDGTPPPEPVMIERVCNGNPRPEGYTDSKGRFNFELGRNTRLFADASVGSSRDPFDDPNSGFGSPTGSRGGGSGMGMDQRLLGCEVRAVLAGFRSDSVNLTGRRALDNPDVGTLVLRRLGNVEGTTISATSLQAPKDAKKAFEKGLEANKKQKWVDAQKHLEKAVGLYPKYAAAWNALGVAYQNQNHPEEARKAYAQALEADPKFIKPHIQLAFMAADERKWQEVADTTQRVVRLNPVDFPEAYLMNSIANLNLRKPEEAEKSAREGLKLDGAKRMPKLQHVMGLALATRGDYAGAAEHIKTYLEQAPQATDVEQARKQLIEVQQRAAQTPR